MAPIESAWADWYDQIAGQAIAGVEPEVLRGLRSAIDAALGDQRYSRAEVKAAVLVVMGGNSIWKATDIATSVLKRLDAARAGMQEG